MSLDSLAPPIPPPTQDSHRSPANLAPASTASTNHDAATTAQERALALGVLQPPSPTSPRLEDEAVWRSPRSSLPAGPVISVSVRSSRFAAGWSPTFPIRHSGPFLTGTVREIAITSNSSKLGERNGREAWHPDGPWELQDVPVAPLTFVHHRRAGTRARERSLVHLELTTPGVAVRRSNRSAGSTLRVTLAGTSAKPVMTAPTGSSATSVSSPT